MDGYSGVCEASPEGREQLGAVGQPQVGGESDEYVVDVVIHKQHLPQLAHVPGVHSLAVPVQQQVCPRQSHCLQFREEGNVELNLKQNWSKILKNSKKK